MKILSANQMAELDSRTILGGISASALMERAGREFFKILKSRIKKKDRLLVIAGGGNNAGDAFVITRLLCKNGYKVQTVLINDPLKFNSAVLTHFKKIRSNKILSRFIKQLSDFPKYDQFDVIIDGLFGTGLNRAPAGFSAQTIKWMNQSHKPIYSIDVPSGFDTNLGCPLNPCVQSAATISFEYPKKGFFNPIFKAYLGDLFVVPIGLKVANDDIHDFVITKDILTTIPKRTLVMHKGSLGHVFIVGGSNGKMGAPILAGLGALRGGAGLVSVLMPHSTVKSLKIPQWELMVEGIPDEGRGHFSVKNCAQVLKYLKDKCSVLVLGPGLGAHPNTTTFVQTLIKKFEGPMIVDADGLNALSKNVGILKQIKSSFCLLTPHPKEMERLSKTPYKKIQKNREEFLRDWCFRKSIFTLLKGAHSLIGTPSRDIYVNPTGNPAMANAGQGDFLSGLLAGVMSEGSANIESVLRAVFWHGLMSDYLVRTKHRRITLASDLAEISDASIQWLQKDQSTLYKRLFP